MAEAGITRVSVGAQQLQDHLIEYSGRRQTAEQVFRAIERAHELEMVANVDLICGWFDQREDDLVADLERLVPLRPESIVVHPLTLAGPFKTDGATLTGDGWTVTVADGWEVRPGQRPGDFVISQK